jgi:hypothetical protein
MSQNLSRMERLARAEEERKRFRQAAALQESPAPLHEITSVPENALVQPSSPVDDTGPKLSLKEPNQSGDSSSLSVASEATVARDATVAFETTVAPNTTVASQPSSLYPDATVAPSATVVPEATVAPDAPVEIRGYGPFTWDLLDRVMPRLDPYEQVVLLRLCRLAWGHKKDTCRVGYERLQQACNLKKRKLQEVVSKLEFLGYIRRLALEQGGSDRSLRGTEYQIILPPPPGVQHATVAGSATVAPDATVAYNATNKNNALKDISKEGVPSRANGCPDCNGTSWFYPNGSEGGVKRCTHPRLPKAGK